MHNVLDPNDDSEVKVATHRDVKDYLKQYVRYKGGLPRPGAEPTPGRVGAMRTRVVDNESDPYGGFSILTPHGRRMQKLLRHRAWMMNEDGSWSPIDVPGPASFDAWWACWKGCCVVLLMMPPTIDPDTGEEIPFVTVQALENDF